MKKPLTLGVLVLFVLVIAMSMSHRASAQDTDTPTFTPTETPTITLTPSLTPTPTSTLNPGITWAPASISISPSMYNGMASQLLATPPPDIGSGVVYGVTAADADGTGGWYISLAHIIDSSPPYSDWNVLDNGDWLGSMSCTGSEGAWTCVYYDPVIPVDAYGAGGNLFPWHPGTWATYTSLGIHTDSCGSGCILPDHYAVDFMGADTWSGSMPNQVFSAASGVVTWSCSGNDNGAVLIEGAGGDFVYYHLQPNQAKMAVGTNIARGEQIGLLTYGNFNDTDTACGGISTYNPTDGYHLHFEFIPVDGFLMLGGCALDMTTEHWLCGSSTITEGGHLNHSGGSSPIPTVTPGGPTVTPIPGELVGTEGGEHIWNGLISGFVSFLNSTVAKLLPEHTAIGIAAWFDKIATTLTDFVWLINSSGLIYSLPVLICAGLFFLLETIRLIYAAYRLVIGLEPIP